MDALPEGEDFIEHFLYDTQEGYSMHFAAAATMMFRMYGIPARYVVGYVAPKELFSRNADGTYTAVLEDDNAHAWTEIYQPFLGWVPVEVTPGMEAELTGDLSTEETEPQTREQTEAGADSSGEESGGAGFFHRLRLLPGISLDTVMAAASVLLAAGIIAGVTAGMLRRRRRRLGLGEAPDGQIRALYRSVYDLLVSAGMPEEYTAADGRVMDWLCGACPAFSAEDAARLQRMVLEANFGRGRVTGEDAQWMLGVYRQVKKSMRRLKKQNTGR